MGNYNRYFIAQESDWEKEKAEHDKVDDGLDVLIQLDRTIDRAFDILSNDKYGNMSRYYYDSIAGRINKCKAKNNNITNYANGIYGVLEDKENAFHKQLSRAMESLSKLDIDEYEVDNTLQIKEYQSYMDYSESGGYQGASNGTLKYREVKKKKITFSDIQAKTDMFQLQDQFANYLKENGKDGKHVPDAEVDKLKKQFYSQQLSTSFDHTVYNDSWWATLSTTLDYIPLVGGLKSIVEGFVGTTMTGEQLSANEKLQYVLMGAVSVAVDCFTFGTATATVQGTKAVIKEGLKIVAKDVLTGWSLNLGSQALANMDLPPQLAFVAHIGLNIAISRSNIKKSKDTLLDSKSFDTWDDMKKANKGTVTKLVDENKPLGGTHPRKWLGNDGTSLTIDTMQKYDGSTYQVWKYTDPSGVVISGIKGQEGITLGQLHHFASNKNKTYTEQFEKITNKYDLGLNDDWNKKIITPHIGSHPNEYHEFILEEMKRIDKLANGDSDMFIKLFKKYIEKPVTKNPDMLNVSFWK
ncbi:MAG: AHH domain-containing protein [Erysipelotrichaceae bacterium]